MRKLLILILCFALQPLIAQEDDSWPVEKSCVAQTDTAPEDWTYDGTILMSGWAGIYGLSADYAEPYVVRFKKQEDYSSRIISPDGQFLAEVRTHIDCRDCPSYWYVPDTVIVISLSEPFQRRVIPISYSYAVDIRQLSFVWFDNTHLILGDKFINAVTGTFEEPPQSIPFGWFSPDKTRDIFGSKGRYGGATDPAIMDLTNDKIIRPLPDEIDQLSDVDWRPDSSQFVIAPAEPQDGVWLKRYLIFDRDGAQYEKLIETATYYYYEISDSWDGFTQDGRYFVFHYYPDMEQLPLIYVADMENQRIYDTCFESAISSAAFSPTANQLVFAQGIEGQRLIQIFDLERWAVYPVAHHQGKILFWRAS